MQIGSGTRADGIGHAEPSASPAGGSLLRTKPLRSGIPGSLLLIGTLTISLSLALVAALAVSRGHGGDSPQSAYPVSELTVVDARAGVRVRQTPGSDGATLGALKTGAQVRIVDGPESVEGEQWVKVSWRSGRLQGWFPLRYLERIGPLDWNPWLAA
jgi:hypothetical protein